MPRIYDRRTGSFYEEVQYHNDTLKWLYNTVGGRILLKTYVSRPLYSKLHAIKERSAWSVRRIQPFIKANQIDMRDFEERAFHSFDDFFTRKIIEGKREIAFDPAALISPADSKLLVYQITDDLKIPIKNSIYDLERLLPECKGLSKYHNGLCLVFRLTVDDYHRYCYMDAGTCSRRKTIPGRLHTVSSLSSRYSVFQENHRIYSVLHTEHLGEIIDVEVGALQVGKICNAPIRTFQKGQEKGYFRFGGSTIVILIQDHKVRMDSDIMKMSRKGIESKVRYGERIGTIQST